MKSSKIGASRGKAQTELLRANINDQVSRLLDQLEDREELKEGEKKDISLGRGD